MEILHWIADVTSLDGNIYQKKQPSISSSTGVICWISHPTGSRQFSLLALTTAPVSCLLVSSFWLLCPTPSLSLGLCLSFVCCFCFLLPSLQSPFHIPRSPTADRPHLQGRERHHHQSQLVTAQHHSHHWLQDHSGCSRRECTHLRRLRSTNHRSIYCLWTGAWYWLWH